MTTAHRPTFDPARGKDAQRGPAYHQRGPAPVVEEKRVEASREKRLLEEAGAKTQAVRAGSCHSKPCILPRSRPELTRFSDDEDETAELQRELEKIKRERAEKREQEEREKAAEEEALREHDIALGNPLLNPKADFHVKRRYVGWLIARSWNPILPADEEIRWDDD
ncbi:hypothetical protein BUE80_DR012112, partial [Diplocarpon rosae]